MTGMNEIKPIVLKPRTNENYCVGVVRLSPEAEQVVRRLHTKSGIPIKQIVSEILIQAEGLIDIDLSDFLD